MIGKRAKSASGILLFLMMISLTPDAWTQPVPDSLISPYDSIQDLRRRRWENGMESRLDGLDNSVRNNKASSDSAGMLLQELQESLREINRIQKMQEQQIDSMAVRLEQARDSAVVYRNTLHRNLWIAGSIFLVLLAASFAYLLVRSVKTRELLRKIRWKGRKDRRKLEGRIAQHEEIVMTAIGSQERRFKKKLKSLKKSRSGKK